MHAQAPFVMKVTRQTIYRKKNDKFDKVNYIHFSVNCCGQQRPTPDQFSILDTFEVQTDIKDYDGIKSMAADRLMERIEREKMMFGLFCCAIDPNMDDEKVIYDVPSMTSFEAAFVMEQVAVDSDYPKKGQHIEMVVQTQDGAVTMQYGMIHYSDLDT